MYTNKEKKIFQDKIIETKNLFLNYMNTGIGENDVLNNILFLVSFPRNIRLIDNEEKITLNNIPKYFFLNCDSDGYLPMKMMLQLLLGWHFTYMKNIKVNDSFYWDFDSFKSIGSLKEYIYTFLLFHKKSFKYNK